MFTIHECFYKNIKCVKCFSHCLSIWRNINNNVIEFYLRMIKWHKFVCCTIPYWKSLFGYFSSRIAGIFSQVSIRLMRLWSLAGTFSLHFKMCLVRLLRFYLFWHLLLLVHCILIPFSGCASGTYFVTITDVPMTSFRCVGIRFGPRWAAFMISINVGCVVSSWFQLLRYLFLGYDCPDAFN